MTTTITGSTLRNLAHQEIRNYLKSKLFWVGAALTAVTAVIGVAGGDPRWSTTGDGIAPAALIGLLGINIMAGLTRNSDRAAAAAGTVAVGQRTRSLALAAAVVVPATVGLAWFLLALVGYTLNPPDADAAAFGPVTETFIYASMFLQGVMACVGGPLLGLVVGRWLPRRGVAPVVSVVVVLVTMVLQPLFTWAEQWRQVWIWVHYYAPTGVEGDGDRAVALTGSPYLHIGYLTLLCVLGVLVSMYRDTEPDRTRLRTLILGVAGAAAVVCVLAMFGGLDERLPNPIPSSSATSVAP
jgi:hypothetical protein